MAQGLMFRRRNLSPSSMAQDLSPSSMAQGLSPSSMAQVFRGGSGRRATAPVTRSPVTGGRASASSVTRDPGFGEGALVSRGRATASSVTCSPGPDERARATSSVTRSSGSPVNRTGGISIGRRIHAAAIAFSDKNSTRVRGRPRGQEKVEKVIQDYASQMRSFGVRHQQLDVERSGILDCFVKMLILKSAGEVSVLLYLKNQFDWPVSPVVVVDPSVSEGEFEFILQATRGGSQIPLYYKGERF